MSPQTTQSHQIIQDYIRLAVHTMRECKTASESDLIQLLITQKVPKYLAVHLIMLLPMIYGRVILADADINFSATYRVFEKNKQAEREFPLASEPVWNEGEKFVEEEIAQGIGLDALTAVAVRSAEFNAVANLLKRGGTLEGAAMQPVLMMRNDFVPSAQYLDLLERRKK